jgi:hypothetical protein
LTVATALLEELTVDKIAEGVGIARATIELVCYLCSNVVLSVKLVERAYSVVFNCVFCTVETV